MHRESSGRTTNLSVVILEEGSEIGGERYHVIFTLFTSELEEYRNRKNIL